MIRNIKNIPPEDLDRRVWRYLTFSKFASVLTYNALWFTKLNILQDQFEGSMPPATKRVVQASHQPWKEVFKTPEFHRQIDNWSDDNVKSGRELLVVNCWFLGDEESQKMWDEYVGSPEGLAIISTIRKLAEHVYVWPDETISQLGRVEYVDYQDHLMTTYAAAQACERALLKDKAFNHEQEIRIVTMNFKTPNCVRMDGQRYTPDECKGKYMNNSENPGLYVGANLRELIQEVVLAPLAPTWFELLVRRIVHLAQLGARLRRSTLENG